MCLNMLMEDIVMNTSNITNYKPKDFAEYWVSQSKR